MLVYAAQISPRLQYVLQLIIVQRYGLPLQTTTSKEAYRQYDDAKICYGEQLEGGIYLAAANILFQTNVEKQTYNVATNETTAPFAQTEGDWPFDLLAAVFYLITRYEEYLPHEQDEFGRYKATNSFAYQTNQLHLPLIDIWLEAFKNFLLGKFPHLKCKQEQFVATTTYDIDTAYALKGKPMLKNIALIIKDIFTGKASTAKQRMSNSATDPYDTYKHIIQINNAKGIKPLFFYLVGDAGGNNRNIPYNNEAMKALLSELKQADCLHGLHPGYETPRNKRLIATEKARLEEMLNIHITKTRQHYLKFYFPTTFVALAELNITDDYSIGYAELPGFRASTCKPFYFYDVVWDNATNLLMHPITFMEGSYAEDMKYTPEQALPEMLALLNTVKKYKGEFVMIWHNHTLSDDGIWKGWKAVHDSVMEELHG